MVELYAEMVLLMGLAVGIDWSRPVKWCKRERHPVEHIYAAAFSRSASGRASSML